MLCTSKIIGWREKLTIPTFGYGGQGSYLDVPDGLLPPLRKKDHPLEVEDQGEPAMVTLPSLSIPSVLPPNYVEQHQAQLLQAVRAVLTLMLGEGATVFLPLGEQEGSVLTTEINMSESIIGLISSAETPLKAAKRMITNYSSALATANPTITIKDEDG
uniref:Uncharacterized protein n=1 Tax=Chromera velia CCMP2878 TaxID=1169474 RepID=A0A0G4GUC2_9ALVE|eukprot:Cvel_5223.t1-p1 / transcript=Cvel_5223.t1 / gene=Cvel_5223 / organism=Chromera_velia_CCMP2878 / gene_product=hypothetical protein / transcript_product=hypothetical protein / location=Cvel_scaffold240:103767-104240(-) / protein_length=158 / sequence_SO=supercontig / SO=protein_coding / is_pseudo=false